MLIDELKQMNKEKYIEYIKKVDRIISINDM
jgi:hypothetical protein